MFLPPSDRVGDMFHICTKVTVEFGAQVSRFGDCKCREVVKNVVALRLSQYRR